MVNDRAPGMGAAVAVGAGGGGTRVGDDSEGDLVGGAAAGVSVGASSGVAFGDGAVAAGAAGDVAVALAPEGVAVAAVSPPSPPPQATVARATKSATNAKRLDLWSKPLTLSSSRESEKTAGVGRPAFLGMVPPAGLEPTHPAPEAGALSN